MQREPLGHVDITSGNLLIFDVGMIAAFEQVGRATAQVNAALEMNQAEVSVLGAVTGVVIRGIAPGRYPVSCDRLVEGDFAGLRRSMTVDFTRGGEVVARTIELGTVAVDCARIGAFDVDAIDHWNHGSPRDGLGDIVLWGLHGAEVAARFGAPQLPDETYGFVDRPVAEALAVAEALQALRERGEFRFAFDFRPHTDDFFLLRQIRGSETESGTLEVDGRAICGLMTTWGDGFFPATLEVDDEGRPLRCTVTFATEPTLTAMTEINGG